MKANEAPEKIYVKITHPISDKYTEIIAFEDGNGIEYTRTDAFIEKACEWLSKNSPDYINYFISHDFGKFVEDFRKAQKGE